jgi:hypothetical protein
VIMIARCGWCNTIVQEKPLKVQLARGSATGQSRVRGWLDPS